MSEDQADGLFDRWSRRKRAIARGEAVEEIGERDFKTAKPSVEDDAEREAELARNLAEAEAVDLDTINRSTDMTVFLKEGVPKVLRNRAMMALWRSDPVFANVDGLVEYGENFNDPGLIMKTFDSAWQAGRGYLEHVKRLAEAEEAEARGEGGDLEVPEATDNSESAATSDSELDPIDQGEAGVPLPVEVAVLSPATGVNAEQKADEGDIKPPAPRVSLRKRLMPERAPGYM